MRLFVGDDWAEDHHDVELMDGSGRRLAKARLPEGVAGMSRLHALVGEQVGEDAEDDMEVVVGIETDRGPWVAALVAAGYTVLAVNPLQAARFRDRLGVSGAKSDAGDTDGLIRERTLKRIAAIEAEACELVDPAARKRLLCEAEAMRSALYELPRRTA